MSAEKEDVRTEQSAQDSGGGKFGRGRKQELVVRADRAGQGFSDLTLMLASGSGAVCEIDFWGGRKAGEH